MGSLLSSVFRLPPSVVAAALGFAIFIGIVLAILELARPDFKPAPEPKFQPGETVSVQGLKGTLISSRCWKGYAEHPGDCTYTVRFVSTQVHTNVPLFGGRRPLDIAPLATVSGIHDFEITRHP